MRKIPTTVVCNLVSLRRKKARQPASCTPGHDCVEEGADVLYIDVGTTTPDRHIRVLS